MLEQARREHAKWAKRVGLERDGKQDPFYLSRPGVILGFLSDGPKTTKEIADYLGRGIDSTGSTLNRMRNQELITRSETREGSHYSWSKA